jgi:hypothetical protein
MHVESARSDGARKNLNFLCDVEVILKYDVSFLCLSPSFARNVHGLIKVAQLVKILLFVILWSL